MTKIFDVVISCVCVCLFIYLEKVRESLRKAPGGLRRPPGGLSRIIRAWNLTLGNFEKSSPKSASHNTSMAPHRLPQVLNKLHEIPQARNKAVSLQTKSQIKLLRNGAKHSFRELSRCKNSTGRPKIRSRPFNDSSYLQQ